MGSTRLPGKVLHPIAGEPLLSRLCKRLRGCRTVATVIVATSSLPQDEVVVQACRGWGGLVFRGAETDVVSRFLGAAQQYKLDTVVRVTADNPLTDPQGIDALVEAYRASGAPLVHNSHRRGYPYGTGAELVSVAALEACDKRSLKAEEREHLTSYLRRHPEEFSCVKVEAPPEVLRPGYFLTVDYPQDAILLERIYERFSRRNDMELCEVIAYLDANPDLVAINARLHQGFEQ